jgi:hypothetical protein
MKEPVRIFLHLHIVKSDMLFFYSLVENEINRI